ncbi:actin 3 like protein [Babesia gibsoni]|uniref:Actin 3 like protein n=1 Tax=Babesia gibsoni TaxID=33632 RepID=A0AAD8LNK8_BABGI|nr:actin 3 like protein [Babesia gibsoni]
MDAAAYAALPRVVLDNGSGSLKFSLATSKRPPMVVPNCVGQPKRKFLSHNSGYGGSDHAASHGDHSEAISEACYSLWEYFCLRPYANGLLYDPNRQRHIWSKIMGNWHLMVNGVPSNHLGISPATSAICITEPNMCPHTCRQTLAELIFEDYGFSLAAIISSQFASDCYYTARKLPSAGRFIPGEVGLISYPDPNHAAKPFDGNSSCCMVLDCGFGSSHCVPFVNSQPIQSAALRSTLAGTHLNAYLKNVASMRTINLEFNELLVQHIKEESCYVSRDFDLELKAARNLKRLNAHQYLNYEYVLPVYSSKGKTHLTKYFNSHRKTPPPLLKDENRPTVEKLAKGEIQSLCEFESFGGYENPEPEQPLSEDLDGSLSDSQTKEEKKQSVQSLNMFSERFAIPEMLFSPQDIQLKECGVVELVYRSLALAPKCLQRDLAKNILITGGSTMFNGFVERFYADLRKLVPYDWEIQVHYTQDSSLTAFYGAKRFAREDSLFLNTAVTRNYYLEHGGLYSGR